jgi:hypothetical protein
VSFCISGPFLAMAGAAARSVLRAVHLDAAEALAELLNCDWYGAAYYDCGS